VRASHFRDWEQIANAARKKGGIFIFVPGTGTDDVAKNGWWEVREMAL